MSPRLHLGLVMEVKRHKRDQRKPKDQRKSGNVYKKEHTKTRKCAVQELAFDGTAKVLIRCQLIFINCCCFFFNFCFFINLAGNESCPQPQTSEHLAAIEIMKLKHILILQNKIDLVKESQAKEQYEQILAFVQGKKP